MQLFRYPRVNGSVSAPKKPAGGVTAVGSYGVKRAGQGVLVLALVAALLALTPSQVTAQSALQVSLSITNNVGTDANGDGRVRTNDWSDAQYWYDRTLLEYPLANPSVTERRKDRVRLVVDWGRLLYAGGHVDSPPIAPERLEVQLNFSGASNLNVYPELSTHEWDASRSTLVVTGGRSNASAGVYVEAYPDAQLGEADETVTVSVGSVTLTGGNNVGASGSGTVSFSVRDNYLSAWSGNLPFVSVAADQTDVNSGSAASFTVSVNPTVPRPVQALLFVHDGPRNCNPTVRNVAQRCSNRLALSNEGFKTVTIPANTTSVTHSVPTLARSAGARGPSGDITVFLRGNTPPNGHHDYRVGSAHTATTRVNFITPLVVVPEPVVTISTAAESATEGVPVSFTVHANPAPAGPLTVNLSTTVTMGDPSIQQIGIHEIIHNEDSMVLLQAGQSSREWTYTVADDSYHLADGTLEVSVAAGDRYSVGGESSLTLPLADNDAPLPDDGGQTQQSDSDDETAEDPLVKYAAVVKSFYDRISARNQHGDGAAGGWNKRFLKAMGHPDYIDYPQPAVTVARATEMYNHGGPGANTAWEGTAEAIQYKLDYDAQLTLPLADNDAPPPDDGGQTQQSDSDDETAEDPLVKYAAVVKSFYDRISARNQHGDGAAGGWNKRFLKAMGHPDYIDYPQPAVTVARATEMYNHGGPGANTAWEGTAEAIQYKLDYDAQ